ncbi:MAG TPA: nicotinate-nucleotide adenylyltransferase [Candidatus Binatia bacterium]|nr:nicotinate-nucleotide adenylyltransferase [Candidatus Binatia bacterium]
MTGGVGIFGGTFNPIHLAHLRAAEEVREALGLAEVRFVPCAVPPHKADAALAAPAHRLRMVELATAGVPGFRAWDVELTRPGPSYSIDTLRALRAEVGERTPVAFALGRDAFADFATWREPDAILGLCDVVVITRPPWPATLTAEDFPVASRGAICYDAASGSFRHASGHTVRLLPVTALDVSATAIRDRVGAGRSIRFLVPAAVEAYIAAAGLYRPEVAAR